MALALGHSVAAGTVGCSLTELDGAGYLTPAASTGLALELDQAQYAAAQGPCVSAARDRQPQRIDALSVEARYPEFVAAALRYGVHSSLSLPIAGRHRPTALNLYSTLASAFASDRALAIANLLSRVIGSVSSTQLTVASPADPDPDLARAQQQGKGVEAAVEKTMHRTGLDRPAAFAALTARSRDRGVGMRIIAEDALRDDGDLP